MELKAYLSILWRRKWVIVVTVVLATLVTAWGSYYLLTPKYKVSATLWVPTTTNRFVGGGDILLAERLMATYATLVTSPPVLAELEQRLGISRAEVNSIDVEFESQTELMSIVVEDPNPQLAADVATNLAEILIKQTRRTKAGRDERVSLFAPAGIPETPSWLGFLSTPLWRELNIMLGFMVSLAVGVGLAFLFEYLDTTLYTTEQIEKMTELARLGEIPIVKKPQQMIAMNGSTVYGEAFRFLRTSIFFDQKALPQTLLVTSALPGEGKSTIVANLAISVAQSGRQVMVVDADLRLPTLHTLFGLPNQVGLTSILKQETTVPEAVQDSNIPDIQIITSGLPTSNPAELLDSTQVVALIDHLKQRADLVLFDTPSLLAVSDAAVLAPMIDGVVLVIGRAQAYQKAVQEARHQLTTVGARFVGIVVNRADQLGDYFNHYASKIDATK